MAIVRDRWGRMLTVTRPDPPYELALPGGEIDPGESGQQAVVRELREETNVSSRDAQLIWIGSSPTDGRLVYVYEIGRWWGIPYAREGGEVAWLTPEQLLGQAIRFGVFYQDLFRATG